MDASGNVTHTDTGRTALCIFFAILTVSAIFAALSCRFFPLTTSVMPKFSGDGQGMIPAVATDAVPTLVCLLLLLISNRAAAPIIGGVICAADAILIGMALPCAASGAAEAIQVVFAAVSPLSVALFASLITAREDLQALGRRALPMLFFAGFTVSAKAVLAVILSITV